MRKYIQTLMLCLLGVTTVNAQATDGVSAQSNDLDSKYATSLLKAGTDAPDFELQTPAGTKVKLSDLRGRYVVLDFWASWCPDCRKDIPEMRRLARQYASNSVAFLAVSFDTDKGSWVKAASGEDAGRIIHVSELKKWKETAVSKLYGINWIPATYIIDPAGKVVMGTVMIDKLGKALASLDTTRVQSK